MKKERRTLGQFEQAHGGSKIKSLEKRLEEEKAKVEALADVQGKIKVESRYDCHLRFAILGDTHIGSLYFSEAALHAFADHCKREGVTAIYHAGDVIDGHRVYRGQEFELRDLGLEAQLDRLEKVWPTGFKTHFITGNHDASFKALAGVSVGTLIEQRRDDMIFLGEDQAQVQFQTPSGQYTLGLLHPGGGSSYALSYRPQKIIDALEGGAKPNMLVIGHHHKAEFLPAYRNVAAIQAGTTQRQTPFMARGGLAAHVGGWIVDVWVGDLHNRIRPEFVAFYG